MAELYDSPKYYEIAFAWRDIKAEVDLFEKAIEEYGAIPVKNVLEICSGNSPHMVELVRRGYRYTGLDLSRAMLDYSIAKAKAEAVRGDFVCADMVDFELKKKYEFAYIMLGSFFATSTREVFSHFESVARVLKKGGLYLLDWCVQFEPPWETKGSSNWEMEQEGIMVHTTVTWEPIKLARQTFKETIVLDVNDKGREIKVTGTNVHRAIYPQEFRRMIDYSDDFEFVGWWNNWDLDKPLDFAYKISRPIILIRRI